MAERGKAHLVEVDSDGLRWVKASRSGSTTGSCVECARTGERVLVRDSKHREQRLRFPGAQWALFVSSIAGNR
ncbi:DUF397 domain-containing protein [Umezawaea beigongshangensis]|uniref:DUF397 domain-containing protein n=1 Tax=Umezawaea beigongshangensis TaxID=2780383 RepID=UPI0027DD0D90|nr:DUF397 domain-containing protein [Umezawaea beigongshangensis]